MQKTKAQRIAVGIHACKEALEVRPQFVKELWLAFDFEKKPALKKIAEVAESKSVKILQKKPTELSKIASSHQGVAAFIEDSPQFPKEFNDQPELLLALDEISDPHNLGAIMRTAWLMGASGVIASQMRSSSLTPSAHKVACGAAEHLPFDTQASLYQKLISLKEFGFWVFGLDAGGSRNLWSSDPLPEKLVLVVGAEGKGLRSSTLKACDETLSISQVEASASYNASVAASLAMSEYVRRQKS